MMAEPKCDCHVAVNANARLGIRLEEDRILYCPMHKAAPDLRDALEDALEGLRNIALKHLIKHDCFNWNAPGDTACPCSLCTGKRALDLARGEEGS